jgi:hypothetical protein
LARIASTTSTEPGAPVRPIPLPTWGLLRQVFTVETIMTPRCDLFTGEQETDLVFARSEARRRRFDLLPITSGGRIIGILPCGEKDPEPLTKQWLVSRDTAIPAQGPVPGPFCAKKAPRRSPAPWQLSPGNGPTYLFAFLANPC